MCVNFIHEIIKSSSLIFNNRNFIGFIGTNLVANGNVLVGYFMVVGNQQHIIQFCRNIKPQKRYINYLLYTVDGS